MSGAPDEQGLKDYFGTPATPPPTGAAHDAIWSSLATAAGRVASATGYGAAEAAGDLDLSPETQASMRKIGIFNDYAKGEHSFVKSANEALIRPGVMAAQGALRLFPTVLSGAASGLEQVEKELGGGGEGKGPEPVAAGVAGGLAELARGYAEGAGIGEVGTGGFVPRPAVPRGVTASSDLPIRASAARSVAVLGEGDKGFYGAEPPTPENLQARAEAAKDAGIEPVPPTPPAADIHELARRVDPETFTQYDALSVERERLSTEVRNMNAERTASPEYATASQQIETILDRVNGVEDRLTKAAAARLEDARGRLDDIVRTDTPDQAALRQQLAQTDFTMRELAPQVSQAYRTAQDMLPEPVPFAETAKGPEGEAEMPAEVPKAEAAPAAEEPAQPTAPAALGATQEGEAAVAPPNVVGETLGAPQPRPRTPYGVREIEGTGEVKERGLSQSVEANAVAKGLAEDLGDLPQYRQMDFAKQADDAAAYLKENPDEARAVALGTRAAPKGLLYQSVFETVKQAAERDGDIDTLRQLANSRQATRLTEAGREIGYAGYANRDRVSDAVSAIQEVQAAREAAFADRGLDATVEKAKLERADRAELAKEKRAVVSKPPAWQALIDSWKC